MRQYGRWGARDATTAAVAEMQRDLRALYNRSYEPGAYRRGALHRAGTARPRAGVPHARGVLRQGIDLYHAGLIIGDVGGPDALHRVYELFVQAAELGYPGAWAQAAMEYDRWLRAQGKPQRFDSFWRWEGDEQMPEPFAAPAAVEALRAEWG